MITIDAIMRKRIDLRTSSFTWLNASRNAKAAHWSVATQHEFYAHRQKHYENSAA